MRVGGLQFSERTAIYLDFPQRGLAFLVIIIKTQIFDRIDQALHVLLPLSYIVENIEKLGYQEPSVLSRFGKAPDPPAAPKGQKQEGNTAVAHASAR